PKGVSHVVCLERQDDIHARSLRAGGGRLDIDRNGDRCWRTAGAQVFVILPDLSGRSSPSSAHERRDNPPDILPATERRPGFHQAPPFLEKIAAAIRGLRLVRD